MRKKALKKAASLALCIQLLGSLCLTEVNARETNENTAILELPGTNSIEKSYDRTFLSATGYVADNISDRSEYYDEYIAYNQLLLQKFIADGGSEEEYEWQNTANYYVVKNEQDFCEALISEAKVIDVQADLNLGFKYLERNEIDSYGVVQAISDYNRSSEPITSPVLMEDGVSQVNLSYVDGMTIFSSNGSTIYHCEFDVQFSNDVVIRNLGLQGMCEWDDAPQGMAAVNGAGGRKRYDWDGIAVFESTNVWIDHCTFGNCYDGTIDITDASTVSITWCKLGVLDSVTRNELQQNLDYMEKLYQEGNGFQFYSALRDGGATQEQIMRFADINDKVHAFSCSEMYYDVNIHDKITMAYNYYHNSVQRVPQIRSGNAHMFNCYVNSMDYMSICDEISEARSYASSKGCSVLGLCRANSALDAATIGTDTCVFEGVTNPIISEEIVSSGIQKGSKNHNLIVNSSTRKYGSDNTYTGSSWDNNGENAFVQSSYWGDKSTINHFVWSKWVDITKSESAAGTPEYLSAAEALKLGTGEFYRRFFIGSDELGYDYQIVPLSEVKQMLEDHGGNGAVTLSSHEWLNKTYFLEDQGHTVNFDDGCEGTVNETSYQVTDGATVVLPAMTHEKEGHTFLGWCTKEYSLDENGELITTLVPFTEQTKITADTYVYANWETNTYKLTLELNGGISSGETTLSYDYDSYVVLNRIDTLLLKKDGYVFDYWCLDAALSKKANSFRITEDTTVYAVWKEDSAPTASPEVSTPPTQTPPVQSSTPSASPVVSPTPVLLGDVDNSGTVTLDDAQLTLRAALLITVLTDEQSMAADYNSDGTVDLFDAQSVLRAALNIM